MGKSHYSVSSHFETKGFVVECREFFWQEPSKISTGRGEYYLSKTMAGQDVIQRTRPVEICGVRCLEAVPTGPMVFMPAQFPLQFSIGPGRMTSLVCVFEPAYFERIAQMEMPVNYQEAVHLLALKNVRIDMIMTRIHEEITSPGLSSELLLESLCTSLVVEFGRHHLQRHRPDSPSNRRPVDVDAIKEYISEHFGNGITIATLAHAAGVSESQVMKCFKQQTGETIHSFLSRVRLQRAEELLLDASYSMKKIAFDLGYSSSSVFAAAFRKTKGITPSDFRNGPHAIQKAYRN